MQHKNIIEDSIDPFFKKKNGAYFVYVFDFYNIARVLYKIIV